MLSLNIQQIRTSAASNVTAKTANNVTKPEINQQERKETTNDKSGLALKNYFLAGQNIPSFKGYDSSTGNFNREIGHTTCACCGKEMITGDQSADVLGRQLSSATGEKRTQFLDEQMNVFRPTEKAYARAIKEQGLKNPGLRTADLISAIARNPENTLKNAQLAVLEDMDNEAKEHLGEKNKVSEFIKTQKPLVTGEEHNNKFSRESFLKKITTVTSTIEDEHAKGHILNKAIDLPFEDDFFKRLLNDSTNPQKFMRMMFLSSVKTAEHIHPESLDGPCNTANYMSECKECNGSRQNYDLNTYWQTNYPSMPYNIQQYVNHVTDNLVDGKLNANLIDYPKDLKIAVESETKGAIKVKVLNPEEINKKRAEKGLSPLVPHVVSLEEVNKKRAEKGLPPLTSLERPRKPQKPNQAA